MAAPRTDVGEGSAHGDTTGLVQRAVEEFIDRCGAGENLDPEQFARGFAEGARGKIAEQCRNYLHFDDFVGRQAWSADELHAPSSRTFGDFLIQEELGRGGMGIVYLAHQRSLNRRVALKVMASGLVLSKRHVERFRREATAAAQLRHPGIVPVHSFTEVDGTFAFAMDYIAGRNLGEILDDLRLANGQGPGPVDGSLGLMPENGYVAECALLCAQVAGALAAAHQAGITHRDIKPRNLMIDDRRQARLLDFGLAKSQDQGSISMSGEITGTAHYMSPEQTLAKRVDIDHRTDVFSLGVILYELLTLRRPFDGKNLQQIVYEICFKEPVPVQRLNPKVPRDLVTVCMKALEKDPQNRYASAQELEQDLQRFLRWEPVHARPAGMLSRAGKWIFRHRTESAAAALLVAAGLTFAGVSWVNSQQARTDGGRLLQRAIERANAHDFAAAEQLATSALERSPSDETRTRLEMIRKERELAATEQERTGALANLLVARSSSLLGSDRKVALRLALDAVAMVDSPVARSAVLEALGAGYRTVDFSCGQRLVCARLSPDGALVAAAPEESPLVMRDSRTGDEKYRLDGYPRAIDVAFHPDGERFAVGERPKTKGAPARVTVFRKADGRELFHFDHVGAVESVRFDREGGRLLTVSYGPDEARGPFHARVFDVATQRELGSVTDHTQFIELAAISPDGRFAASCGDPGFVRLWDAGTGQVLRKIEGRGARLLALAFAPESDLVATADLDGNVRLFAVPSGDPVCEVRHGKGVNSLAFDGSGGRLLTASRDQTARLWTLDVPGRRAIETSVLVGHRGEVTCAAIDSDTRLAATGCQDGVVRVFDLGGDELKHLEFGQRISRVAFDRQARRVLVHLGDGSASAWDLDGERATVSLRQDAFVRAVAFTGDGQQVVAGDDNGHVDVWNARDGQRVPRVLPKLDKSVRALDVDPKSRRALVATESGKLAFYNLQDGGLSPTPEGHGKSVNAVHFSADGERVVTASDDGTAAVFNARDAALLCRVAVSGRAIAAALSSDGALLATIATEPADTAPPITRACLWSVPAGQKLRELGGTSSNLAAVVFLPDGRSLLLAGDRCAKRYSIDGAFELDYPVDIGIGSAAIDRAGRKLLLCSNDPLAPVAQIWDVASGALLLRCTSHRGPLLAGALDADGAYAATASRDHTVQVWPTDPVEIAKKLNPRELTAADRLKLSLPPPRTTPPK